MMMVCMRVCVRVRVCVSQMNSNPLQRQLVVRHPLSVRPAYWALIGRLHCPSTARLPEPFPSFLQNKNDNS